MSHLTLETIARLVDEEPTAAEAAHLEACANCRTELDAMRDDVHTLSLLPDMAPAPDAWDALEQRLGEEGLIRTRRTAPGVVMQRFGWAAAAMVVFVAGSVAGRLSAPSPVQVAQQDPPQVVEQAAPRVQEAGPSVGALAGDVPAADSPSYPDALVGAGAPEAAAQPVLPRRAPGVTLAADAARPALPRSMDEAAALLRQTEELYLAALTRYAELATQADAGDPVARLAALQSIVMTTQAALSQAPTDPVINGYHLTALAQRDATLRQVAANTNDRLY